VEEKRKFEDITQKEDDEKKEKDTPIVSEMIDFEDNEDLIHDWLEENV